VLDGIFPLNVSLQVLDGIACHNGEMELPVYEPAKGRNFAEFDAMIEGCYLEKNQVRKLMPATLEGAVMRISDIIAYLGKDRQDAVLAKAVTPSDFTVTELGADYLEMINNLIIVGIVGVQGRSLIGNA
jgi:dGTPase